MMIPAHALAGIACIHLGLLAAHNKDGEQRWNNAPAWTWLAIGIAFAYMSHAVVDALAIFTYHDSNPTGSAFEMVVFWGWLIFGFVVIYWGVREDKRYGLGVLAALAYDLWDHYILRAVDCVLDGFPKGCMGVYTHRFKELQMHQFEWAILDSVFAGVERHYGDEAFVLLEIVFVGFVVAGVRWLRINYPLPLNANPN
jgi:hypothetical protein